MTNDKFFVEEMTDSLYGVYIANESHAANGYPKLVVTIGDDVYHLRFYCPVEKSDYPELKPLFLDAVYGRKKLLENNDTIKKIINGKSN